MVEGTYQQIVVSGGFNKITLLVLMGYTYHFFPVGRELQK
jgi:hypothetical protein